MDRRMVPQIAPVPSIGDAFRGIAPFALAVLFALAIAGLSPASALVRFGPNVFIGGHDFSHQTFGPGRRAVIYLYPHTPRNAGCRWHADGRGGRVKVCRLRRL